MDLTDIEKVLLELLLLRHRNGDTVTELDEGFSRNISVLVRKGYVSLVASKTPHKVRVMLSDESVAEFLDSGGYLPPDFRKKRVDSALVSAPISPLARAGGTILPL